MRFILAEIGASSQQPVEILVEYGSVFNGDGEARRVEPGETEENYFKASESTDQESVSWRKAFEDKWLDPNATNFLVKIRPADLPVLEAWAIAHEIGAHVIATVKNLNLGVDGEHEFFGGDGNFILGAGMPTPGSRAAGLYKDFYQPSVHF